MSRAVQRVLYSKQAIKTQNFTDFTQSFLAPPPAATKPAQPTAADLGRWTAFATPIVW